MKRYTTEFLDNLGGFDFNVLEKSRFSICALSNKLKFIYVNHDWCRFAENNGHVKLISDEKVLGTSALRLFKGIRLKLYFRKNYKKVISSGEIWHHQYENIEKTKHRLLHQSVYPLDNKSGILIIHSEVYKLPMSNMNYETFHIIEERYFQSNGHIVQCSNCRHTQRADQPEIWDWVPDWVEKLPANYSLSICPTCEHLYQGS
ncbi:hypothetical protein [Maribacter sp. HTCC2170]|uniref:hypothetical protein n=1 Tax=Maribacter sp. (strain HTCC2170 / KCCM 42371) TaxID=313603 RepID=UPI00006B21F5|nr:hypothetical protein [Maribacter sp. HTCC2170]EAR00359.1 hypothetical protein FB2170_13096 [Maribacter sp. HTCC2170]